MKNNEALVVLSDAIDLQRETMAVLKEAIEVLKAAVEEIKAARTMSNYTTYITQPSVAPTLVPYNPAPYTSPFNAPTITCEGKTNGTVYNTCEGKTQAFYSNSEAVCGKSF